MDFRRPTRYNYRRRRNLSLYRYRQSKAFLSSIKKDILKCNFPTKVKLIKLNEKKTMYLTDEHPNYVISAATGSSLPLFPTKSSNILSFMHKGNALDGGSNQLTFRFGDWDTIRILRVIIKVQPITNIFAGGNQNIIQTVNCFYSMNNAVETPNALYQIQPSYDNSLLNYKQKFTFNNNESFTLVIEKPQTMSTDSPVVHSYKTTWSLSDQTIFALNNGNWQTQREDNQDDSENEEECEYLHDKLGIINSPLYDAGVAPAIHCGRLYFKPSGDCAFNITINYKVALKG